MRGVCDRAYLKRRDELRRCVTGEDMVEYIVGKLGSGVLLVGLDDAVAAGNKFGQKREESVERQSSVGGVSDTHGHQTWQCSERSVDDNGAIVREAELHDGEQTSHRVDIDADISLAAGVAVAAELLADALQNGNAV